MGCGCNKKVPRGTSMPRAGGAGVDNDGFKTALLMCRSCRYGGRGENVHVCRVNGQSVAEAAATRSCPKGWHPDENGIVRKWWLRYRGVPAWIRLVYPFRWEAPGCGCLDGLKRWTEASWIGRIQRWVGPSPSPWTVGYWD